MSRRRYHGAVSVNLGSYASFDRSVSTKDVLIGLGIGIVGAAVGAYGLKKARSMVNPINALSPPASGTDWIKLAAPAVGGAGAGFAAWMLRKKKSKPAAFANLLGAAGAGALIAFAYSPVAAQVGFMGNDWMYDGAVGLQVPLQGYGGLIVNDSAGESNQGLHGFLVNDSPAALRGYADRSGMGRLAAASLDPDEDYSEMSRLASFSNYRELDIEGQG